MWKVSACLLGFLAVMLALVGLFRPKPVHHNLHDPEFDYLRAFSHDEFTQERYFPILNSSFLIGNPILASVRVFDFYGDPATIRAAVRHRWKGDGKSAETFKLRGADVLTFVPKGYEGLPQDRPGLGATCRVAIYRLKNRQRLSVTD